MKLLFPLFGLLCLATPGLSQAPKITTQLAFDNGAKVEVAYRAVDLAAGKTLANLTSEGADGEASRKMFNGDVLDKVIGGSLEINRNATIAGQTLNNGSYRMSFRIDEDRIWYMVVSTKKNEELFRTVLDVAEDEDAISERLSVNLIAEDNATTEGRIVIRFGALSAEVPFQTKNN